MLHRKYFRIQLMIFTTCTRYIQIRFTMDRFDESEREALAQTSYRQTDINEVLVMIPL
jgi:hypothetical protein